MAIGCLISFLLVVLFAIVVLIVLEKGVGAIYPMPGQVWMVIRLIVALIVLLYGLQCFTDGGGMAFPFFGRRCP